MQPSLIPYIFLLSGLLGQVSVLAQAVPGRLSSAFGSLLQDPQLRNGIASLYVINAKTGQVVYEQNGMIGLSPASTLKVITSVSAFELLGPNFRYKTDFAYETRGEETSLLIFPSGDPTFGSWRWSVTKEEAVFSHLIRAIRKTPLKSFDVVRIDREGWHQEAIPDGWTWQDIGNYYGAGTGKLNWRENQYDVLLKSGKNIGDPVHIVGTVPTLKGYGLRSEVSSAAAGTGDQAYIYFQLQAAEGTIRGTIPINQTSFKIAGALPSATDQFVGTLQETLAKAGIQVPAKTLPADRSILSRVNYTPFHSVSSPSLDSIIFLFNRKSINLYGEALVKTIAYRHEGTGATAKGVNLIRKFWEEKGIPESELNMVDGSGLSPHNRVTTHAQVRILLHAKTQPWFNSFYASLPEYNGMKMKSGTIRATKGFCGYHRSKDGQEYIFAFLVNNYSGSSSAMVQKMYKVLDVLK
jgi:serine-type D-Ala-D-Ala carboxypeptidase/endopeptidase (penicillin-binding protein 4)